MNEMRKMRSKDVKVKWSEVRRENSTSQGSHTYKRKERRDVGTN